VIYPNGYLQPIISNVKSDEVCGICALKISNQALGIERKKFDGEMAEHLRQLALNWRRDRKGIKEIKVDYQKHKPDETGKICCPKCHSYGVKVGDETCLCCNVILIWPKKNGS